jgi:hypothetical protein
MSNYQLMGDRILELEKVKGNRLKLRQFIDAN